MFSVITLFSIIPVPRAPKRFVFLGKSLKGLYRIENSHFTIRENSNGPLQEQSVAFAVELIHFIY